jgi:dienelactone hydrolase
MFSIQSNGHFKGKIYIRMIYIMVVMLLFLLSILEWGFRYYGLGFFLLLIGLLQTRSLYSKKKEKRAFKVGPGIIKTTVILLMIFIIALPSLVFPEDKVFIPSTGSYKISREIFTYEDKNRIESYSKNNENRSLNVEFWFPDNENISFPLIVFSHGAMGVRSSNESLYRDLASHGYVVCSIDHSYHSFFTKDVNGKTLFIDRTYIKELSSEDSLKDLDQSFLYYKKWMKIRMDDMNFVLDYIINEKENKKVESLYQKIDLESIGVMGHSLGGSAALGMPRIRDDIKAVIALEAPFMFDILGTENGAFTFNPDVYPIPVLNIYSDSGWKILDKRPQYERNLQMLDPYGSDIYNLHILGSGHLSLTDFVLTSPYLTGIIDGNKISQKKAVENLKSLNKASLEFFDRYLKNK